MARLNMETISKTSKERNSIHEKALATYTVFDENGQKFVQLDTYGKSSRANPGKISQSIQFDEDSARFFVNLLIKEFKMTF